MREDFKKYSLLELHKLLPIIEMRVDNYLELKVGTDYMMATHKDFVKWNKVVGRIQKEIRSRK